MLARTACFVVRTVRILALVLLAACNQPTGAFDADLDEYLRSLTATLAGTWSGSSTGPDRDALTLELTLVQAAAAVSGAGKTQERGVTGRRAVTVVGTYRTPLATLTIRGMQFEGRAVTGTLVATNFLGTLVDTLVLTGENYERKLPVRLSRP